MSPLAIRWARDLEAVGPAHRPEGHLLGSLLIAGVPHHVEAFEVEEREGCQESVLPDSETSFAELSEIAQKAVSLWCAQGVQVWNDGIWQQQTIPAQHLFLSHHSPSGAHTRHDGRVISAATTFNECVNGRHYLRNMK